MATIQTSGSTGAISSAVRARLCSVQSTSTTSPLSSPHWARARRFRAAQANETIRREPRVRCFRQDQPCLSHRTGNGTATKERKGVLDGDRGSEVALHTNNKHRGHANRGTQEGSHTKARDGLGSAVQREGRSFGAPRTKTPGTE